MATGSAVGNATLTTSGSERIPPPLTGIVGPKLTFGRQKPNPGLPTPVSWLEVLHVAIIGSAIMPGAWTRSITYLINQEHQEEKSRRLRIQLYLEELDQKWFFGEIANLPPRRSATLGPSY